MSKKGPNVRKTACTASPTGIEELSPCISAVDEAITSVSNSLEPLLNCPVADIAAKVSPLQRAKLDLVSLFAANSLFWVYLRSQGVNPATHGLAKELERVKAYLKRMKELEDRKLAPRIDTQHSKRLMRNALWVNAHKAKAETDTTAGQSTTADPTADLTADPTADPTAPSEEPAGKSVEVKRSHQAADVHGEPSTKKKKKKKKMH